MSADGRLAESANAFAAHHDGWEDAARAYAHFSEPLFIAGVLLLAAAGLGLRRRGLVAASVPAVAAAGLGVALAGLLSRVVDRPRPFVAHPAIHAFLAHAPDPGFPSDHATAAFAIAAVLLARLGRRALPVLAAGGSLAPRRGRGARRPPSGPSAASSSACTIRPTCSPARCSARPPRSAASPPPDGS